MITMNDLKSTSITVDVQRLTRGKKHWGDDGMASYTARIVSLTPGYDRSSKSPTTFYCENVVCKAKRPNRTLKPDFNFEKTE